MKVFVLDIHILSFFLCASILGSLITFLILYGPRTESIWTLVFGIGLIVHGTVNTLFSMIVQNFVKPRCQSCNCHGKHCHMFEGITILVVFFVFSQSFLLQRTNMLGSCFGTPCTILGHPYVMVCFRSPGMSSS